MDTQPVNLAENTVARELDALVAEHALGHQIIRQKSGAMKEKTRQGAIRPLRNYSKDIAAAWEIVERLGITLIPISDGSWFAFVGSEERFSGPGDFLKFLANADFTNAGAAVEKSAPLAVCLAAIKAVEKRTAVPKESFPEAMSQTTH